MPTNTKRFASAGRDLLFSAFHTKKPTRAEIARQLGTTPQAVSAWVNGWAKPSPEKREALARILGIPVSSWDDENEAA